LSNSLILWWRKLPQKSEKCEVVKRTQALESPANYQLMCDFSHQFHCKMEIIISVCGTFAEIEWDDMYSAARAIPRGSRQKSTLPLTILWVANIT